MASPAEVRVFNAKAVVEYTFDPAKDNKAQPEPVCVGEDDVAVGIVPVGGRALVTIFDPGTDSRQERALIKHRGDYIDVVVGERIGEGNSGKKVRIKRPRRTYTVENETKTIPVGNAELDITHW